MPTGTVSRDGTGSRTYPLDGSESSDTTAESTVTHRREPASSTASVDDSPVGAAHTASQPSGSPKTAPATTDARSLRRENEALRETNAQLKAQLEAAYEDKQNVIDRYERIVSELQSRSSPSDASLKRPSKQSPKKASRKRRRGTPQSLPERVMAHVLSAVGLY
ncbi:hypothetical protein C455_13977 [Haloferax larsenii JCM 13917]|nr:hypothetical protein C455_13977 [Haloferax larsenii JCM 13917]